MSYDLGFDWLIDWLKISYDLGFIAIGVAMAT